MEKIKSKIKQLFANFKGKWSYLSAFNSPFVGLRMKWYFGEIKFGTPYFLPRKWVKCDLDDALKAWDKLGERSQIAYLRKQSKESWMDNYMKHYTKPIPFKYFGFNSCTLGWKTKWNSYRWEWSPCYSFVIFGKQLFVTVLPNIIGKDENEQAFLYDVYWEAWLNYHYETNKNSSKEGRFLELIKKHSCKWIDKDGSVDYYPFILKKKYLKIYKNEEKNT